MKLFNLLFYILLFIGFFLPTNSNFYLPLPGVLLKVNELAFLLLPIVNIFCISKNQVKFNDFKLKRNIILLIAIVLFTEVIVKNLIFNQTIGDAFKTFRIGLPLFSSLVLLVQGIRADIKIVWKVFLWAISSSVILSISSIFITLPIYYDLEIGENILNETQGRIINSNAAFGIIGLYLLFKDKDKWYNQGRLVKFTSILSIISLVLTFNRTYLALLILELFYLVYITFSVKQFFRFVISGLVLMGIVNFAYNSSPVIQRQIDKRILSIVMGEVSWREATIESNRDKIYEGIYKRFDEGYWMIGLPYKIGFFDYYRDGSTLQASKTDISFINVILRYGILPFFILFIIHRQLFVSSPYFYRFIFISYFLVSFNTDSLLNQNSVFFIILIFLILKNEKIE